MEEIPSPPSFFPSRFPSSSDTIPTTGSDGDVGNNGDQQHLSLASSSSSSSLSLSQSEDSMLSSSSSTSNLLSTGSSTSPRTEDTESSLSSGSSISPSPSPREGSSSSHKSSSKSSKKSKSSSRDETDKERKSKKKSRSNPSSLKMRSPRLAQEGEGPVTSKSTSSLLSSSDASTEEKKKERRKKLGQSKSLAEIPIAHGDSQTTSKSKSVSSLAIPPTNTFSSSLSPPISSSLKHRSHSDADIGDHERKSVSFSSEVGGGTKTEDGNLTNRGGQSVPFPALLVPQSSMGQMIALAGRNRSRSEEEVNTSSFGNRGLWEGMNHLDFNNLGAGGLGELKVLGEGAEVGGQELWPPTPTPGSVENTGTTPRGTLAPLIIIEQPSPHTSHSKLEAQGAPPIPPASSPTPSATPSPGHSQPPSPRGGGKKTNIGQEDLEIIEKSSIRRLRVVEREETRKAMLFDIFNGSSLPRVEILHGNFTLDLLNSADCLVLPIPLNPTMGPTPFIKAIAGLLGDEILPLIRRVYNKGFGAIPPNDTTLIPLFSTGSQEGEDKQTSLVHLAPRLAGLTPWSSLPSPLKVAPKLSYLLCVGVWKHENSTRKEVFVRDAFRSALMEVDAHNFRILLSQGEEVGGEGKTRKSLDGGLFASQNRFIGELLSPHFLLKEMTRPEVTGENMALAYLAYCKSKRWLDSGAHLTHGDFSKALTSGNLFVRGVADHRELREIVVRAANISGVIPPEEQAQSMRLLNYYLQRPNREEDAGSMFWTRDTVLQFIRDQALQFYSVASQTLNNSASNPPRRGTVVQPLDHEGAQKNPHHFSPVWLEALIKNAVNPDIPDVVKFKPYIPFDSKDVELGSRLGKGFYGVVKKAAFRPYGPNGPIIQTALKEITMNSKDPKANIKLRKEIAREITIMSIIKHPRILPCLGARWVANEVWILTELADSDLYKYLTTRPSGAHRLRIGQQVAEGMMHLHSLNYMHRDLKSLNVLVFQRGGGVDVKLADFGTCRITDFTMTLEVGTPRWTAPEVSGSDNNNYTHKADVYSFGILMWELLMMQQPYSDFKGHNLALSRKIVEEGLRPLVPPGIQTHPFVILMKKCWDANPSVRPNFTDVLALLLQVPDLPDPLSTYTAGMGSSGASGGGGGRGTGGAGAGGGGAGAEYYLAQAQGGGGNQPSALLKRKSTIR